VLGVLPSYDIITQASSGFMSITGFPETPPTRGGGSLGDYVQGLFGAYGVMAALCARERTGRGQAVDISSQDAMFSMIDAWPFMFAASGRLPERVGNAHLGTAPYDSYRARDGWVVIAVASNKLFRNLMDAIGRPELGRDERFRGVSGRIERREEINGIVSAWVAERAVADVTAALGPDGAGIPCSPVYTPDQLVEHPQLVARGMVERRPHPVLGEILLPGIVAKMSETPGAITQQAPALGEHNAEVYGELLGLTPADLERLKTSRAI
jgi:crotonobetainyl-CoA:carnitine CoA-transferase CaiB-like acyl-CoA transferase